MAKENINTTAEGEPNTTPAPVIVDVAKLEAAVTEAQLKVAGLTLEADAAMEARDLTKMLEIAGRMTLANRDTERAKGNLAGATYSIRAAERLEFSVELKEAVLALVAGYETKARELSLTSVHATFGKDGGIQVNVTDSAKPVGARQTRSTTRIPGEGVGTRPRANVLYEGSSYGAREFIEKFGGQEGADAIYAATEGWKTALKKDGTPVASTPGYDQFKRSLMRKLGATFEDGTPA